jgi:hypothetical protein
MFGQGHHAAGAHAPLQKALRVELGESALHRAPREAQFARQRARGGQPAAWRERTGENGLSKPLVELAMEGPPSSRVQLEKGQ